MTMNEPKKFRHGSLFSGIGGFDLAAEWMNWENVFHCEWNPFGQRVLKYYWPNAESFDDITKTDFSKYHGTIDLISGGFPCQPYSMAGKRLGKADERHLWPHMLRAIAEIAPGWVVGENVRGLTNWNGGMVFDEVCSDLENLGYSVAPYLIPACATNAPHKRERIWFIAYRESSGIPSSVDQRRESQPQNGTKIRDRFGTNGNEWNATDPDCGGLERSTKVGWNSFNVERKSSIGNAADTPGQQSQWSEFEFNEFGESEQRKFGGINCELGDNDVANTTGDGRGKNNQNGKPGFIDKTSSPNTWDNFPTESPVCRRNDGFSAELDGITFSKWRNESIKAFGNAVCPNVVLQIFKTIEMYEQQQQQTVKRP